MGKDQLWLIRGEMAMRAGEPKESTLIGEWTNTEKGKHIRQ